MKKRLVISALLLALGAQVVLPGGQAATATTPTGPVTDWGAMFAMATVAILPVLLVFFVLQKCIVEGISTIGLKG